MNTLRLLMIGLITTVMAASVRADDKTDKPDIAKSLVGKWQVTSAEKELPVGALIEFTKDGKMKITAEFEGEKKSIEAVYQVKGDKLHFTLKLADKDEKKDPLAIKTISETKLILEGEKSPTFEFKRVK